MQRWEYLILNHSRAPENKGEDLLDAPRWTDDRELDMSIVERLNKLGEEGWELVNFSPVVGNAIMALKRPLSSGEKGRDGG